MIAEGNILEIEKTRTSCRCYATLLFLRLAFALLCQMVFRALVIPYSDAVLFKIYWWSYLATVVAILGQKPFMCSCYGSFLAKKLWFGAAFLACALVNYITSLMMAVDSWTHNDATALAISLELLLPSTLCAVCSAEVICHTLRSRSANDVLIVQLLMPSYRMRFRIRCHPCDDGICDFCLDQAAGESTSREQLCMSRRLRFHRGCIQKFIEGESVRHILLAFGVELCWGTEYSTGEISARFELREFRDLCLCPGFREDTFVYNYWRNCGSSASRKVTLYAASSSTGDVKELQLDSEVLRALNTCPNRFYYFIRDGNCIFSSADTSGWYNVWQRGFVRTGCDFFSKVLVERRFVVGVREENAEEVYIVVADMLDPEGQPRKRLCDPALAAAIRRMGAIEQGTDTIEVRRSYLLNVLEKWTFDLHRDLLVPAA